MKKKIKKLKSKKISKKLSKSKTSKTKRSRKNPIDISPNTSAISFNTLISNTDSETQQLMGDIYYTYLGVFRHYQTFYWPSWTVAEMIKRRIGDKEFSYDQEKKLEKFADNVKKLPENLMIEFPVM